MCGIIAYVGSQNVIPILMNGLHRLEYRGYDSAGIAIKDNGILVQKKAGNVSTLQDSLQSSSASIGIGHTRWATHGEPNELNAHPHLDCTKQFAIVHNGVIENFVELKRTLIEDGHEFSSETDSEVLAHLIEKFYKGDLLEAVHATTKVIEGAYGLVVVSSYSDEIVTARRGSPIVLAKADHGVLIASDACAIADHSRDIVYLKDGEIAVANRKEFRIMDENLDHVHPEIQPILTRTEDIAKGAYPHFMLKEINEQPEAIRTTLRGRIRNGRMNLSGLKPGVSCDHAL
ncbi:MAG: hypothetical protein ABIA93_03120 [Candidatus Woesearchaeota archaeon]